MDLQPVWAAINEIQNHITTINGELGKTQIDVEWLTYTIKQILDWVKVIVCGVGVVIFTSAWNIIISHRNNGRKT